MQYIMVIYQGDALERQAALSEEEQKQVYADYAAINKTPGVTTVPPMGLPENATTVRVEGGKTLTTDGPFVGMKEAVGGCSSWRLTTSTPRSRLPPVSRRRAMAVPWRFDPRRCIGSDARSGLPRGLGPRAGHPGRLPR